MHACELNLTNIMILMIALTPLQLLHAQDNCGDECKLNDNVAMILNVPVNSTAEVVSIGWGTVAGIGYNFNRRQALIGEFLWNRVYASSGPLDRCKRLCNPAILAETLTLLRLPEITGTNYGAGYSALISSAAVVGISETPTSQNRSQ